MDRATRTARCPRVAPTIPRHPPFSQTTPCLQLLIILGWTAGDECSNNYRSTSLTNRISLFSSNSFRLWNIRTREQLISEGIVVQKKKKKGHSLNRGGEFSNDETRDIGRFSS